MITLQITSTVATYGVAFSEFLTPVKMFHFNKQYLSSAFVIAETGQADNEKAVLQTKRDK